MIFWLNQGERYPAHLGVEREVLRADEYAALLDADATLARAHASASEIVAAARHEAAVVLQAAQDAADRSVRRAEERYAASGRLGYAAGLRRALDEAHAAMQLQVRDARGAALRSQQRLAGVVMKAVEQIVLETNRDALFARIGLTLQRLIESDSYLSLRVHADDAARARVALQQAAASACWRGGFDVIVEADAARGSCVCEWDYGVLVTGLDNQLAAIRRALLTPFEEPADGDADVVSHEEMGYAAAGRDETGYEEAGYEETGCDEADEVAAEQSQPRIAPGAR